MKPQELHQLFLNKCADLIRIEYNNEVFIYDKKTGYTNIYDKNNILKDQTKLCNGLSKKQILDVLKNPNDYNYND